MSKAGRLKVSKEISCFIRFRHRGQNLSNLSVRVLNTDIRATTDEQGIAELRFAENINELILVSLESEEYIESTQTCFAKQYQDKNNPYTILTQLANFAITNLTMYQEQPQDNTKQTPIYTAQPYITNNQAQSNNTPISSNTQTHTNATDSQHLICLQAHIQTLQGGKMSAIQWGYYIKQSNENLKSRIAIKDLKSFTFTSNDTYNTKISFDINAKFTYTITENNTQKEITDYLKDNQQLIIFAYRKSPAYTTSYGTPHTILTISQYPILKLTNKTLTILYTHTNTTYTLKHSCDTHYLSENLKNERIYTLELRDSNLYIKDKTSNADIALMLTKEIPNIQEKTILLDSKDLQALQTTLGLHTHRDRVEIYVEVEKPYYIDSEGYLHWEVEGEERIRRAKEIWQKVKHADQTKQLATALEKGSLTQQQTKAIILHRTNTDTSLQAVNGFLGGLGTHFLIDTDGTIYQCASLYKYTQHVGKIGSKCYDNDTCDENYKKTILGYYQGKIPKQIHDNVRKEEEKNFTYPNRYPINSESIGIEVVGKANNLKILPIDKKYPQIIFNTATWDTPTQAQKDSIKNLVEILKEEYNLSDDDIYEHDDISPQKVRGEAKGLYEKE